MLEEWLRSLGEIVPRETLRLWLERDQHPLVKSNNDGHSHPRRSLRITYPSSLKESPCRPCGLCHHAALVRPTLCGEALASDHYR